MASVILHLLILSSMMQIQIFAEPLSSHTTTSTTESMTPEEKRKHIFLFDLPTKKAIKAEGKLIPHRMYLRWDLTLKRWVLDLTDSKGKLPSPGRALLEKSVIPGNLVGESKKKVFTFGGKGSMYDAFIETPTAKIEFYMWEDGDPPKKLTYLDPDGTFGQ